MVLIAPSGTYRRKETKRLLVLAGEPRGGEHQGTCEHEELAS